jgi:hypothetical protein
MSTAASFCDGQGNCPAGTNNGCSPFLCGSTACLTTCSGTGAGQCASGAACISGTCQTCSSGRTACGTVCADETSDPNHCGSCTTACGGTTPLCVNKNCVQCSAVSDCHTGYFACTNNSCVCRAKSSKNLIPNAGFDTNVSGWISQESMATWSGVDADGCPASGSITAPQGDVLEYCVQNVLPNTTYYLGYKYIQDQGNGVDCFVTWTSDTACQNDISKFDTLSGANTGSAWSSASNLGTSGAGTVAAYIQCLLNANANIDQIYLSTVISGF